MKEEFTPSYVPCDTDCIHRDTCSSPLKGSVEAVNCEQLKYQEEEVKMEMLNSLINFIIFILIVKLVGETWEKKGENNK